MNNLYVLLLLLFVFFMLVIGEVFKIKKDLKKVNRMLSLLINEKKKNGK